MNRPIMSEAKLRAVSVGPHPAPLPSTHPPAQAELIKSSLAQRNIPPHHPEATTAEEAYRSEEIVPPALRDALEVTKLFPAANKPDYRQQLNSSGMVSSAGGLPASACPDVAQQAQRAEQPAQLGLQTLG